MSKQHTHSVQNLTARVSKSIHSRSRIVVESIHSMHTEMSKRVTLRQLKAMTHARTHACMHTQPFYGSLDFVRDNLSEPVPEETITLRKIKRKLFTGMLVLDTDLMARYFFAL